MCGTSAQSPQWEVSKSRPTDPGKLNIASSGQQGTVQITPLNNTDEAKFSSTFTHTTSVTARIYTHKLITTTQPNPYCRNLIQAPLFYRSIVLQKETMTWAITYVKQLCLYKNRFKHKYAEKHLKKWLTRIKTEHVSMHQQVSYHTQHTQFKLEAFQSINIPVVEDIACRSCSFGSFPACLLDIVAEEVMHMVGLRGNFRPLAVGERSTDCLSFHTSVSAS